MRTGVMTMLAVAMLIVAGACGGGDDGGEGRDAAATATRADGGGATPGGAAPADGDGTTLTIVVDDLKFDASELEAPAGTVTVVLMNEDDGQPHNISFHRGNSRKGETVGETDIENGPATSEMTMQLEAGEYYYLCDVHPSMKGVLVVG